MRAAACSPRWPIDRSAPCDFPRLGQDTLRHRIGVGHLGQPVVMSAGDPVLVQRVRQPTAQC